MQFDLEGENSNCDLQSALFLDKENHQEIKTKMTIFFSEWETNHGPMCKDCYHSNAKKAVIK